MRRLSFIILCILMLSSRKTILSQNLNGVDVLPIGGEYSVQRITSDCETRYNGYSNSRLVAESFTLDEDGDLRIGNEDRYRQYRPTDEVGVFTSTVNGGPYRTITILSDTSFIEETIWSDGSPCNSVDIYNHVAEDTQDIDNVDGIPLPRASADIGFGYNVNRLRENCTIFENGQFTWENSQVNFKLQSNGQVLVASYGETTGYSTGTYYVLTDIPGLYARQYSHSLSTIRLISPDFFQRNFYYEDGCKVSDTYYLPGEALLALDEAAIEGEPADGDLLSESADSQPDTSERIALINGVTFERPAEWDVSAGSDTSILFMGYRDEELDTYIEMRVLARDGLVFGFEEYVPSEGSMVDIITAYYMSNPPAYTADGVTMTDVSIAGLSGMRGELVVEGQLKQFVILETGVGGYVGVAINMVADARDTWQPFIDEWLTTISTDTAFEGGSDFMIELSTGEIFNPDTAEVGFSDFQNFQLYFSMNGTPGETASVTINPQMPLSSGIYQLQDVTMGQPTLGALINIPMMINDELYLLNYTTGVEGTLDLTYNGASVSGTINFTAGFSRFIQGIDINASPENPPEFPDSITVTGTFSNLVPPPLEE